MLSPAGGPDQPTLTARTLDRGRRLDTYITFVPSDTVVEPALVRIVKPELPDLSWTVSHAYVAASNYLPTPSNPLPTEQYCYSDGLNEAGLSAALLALPGTTFPTSQMPGPGGPQQVFSLLVVAYVLGCYGSIEQLKADITAGQLVIVAPATPTEGYNSYHYIVQDAQRRTLIIESTDEGLICYDTHDGTARPEGVLTNASAYPWHLANLSNYENLRLPISQGDAFVPMTNALNQAG